MVLIGRTKKSKDPITQFMEDLKSELDSLVKVYVEKYPSTELSRNFPYVVSLMGATSIVGIIKTMIKK